MKFGLNYLRLILSCLSLIFAHETDPDKEFDKQVSSISAIEFLLNDTADVHETIFNYQPQIEYALVWRTLALNTYANVNEKDVLKASEISYLNFAATRYKDLRETLLKEIAKYSSLTNKNVTLKINQDQPTRFYKKRHARQLFGGNPEEIIQINPHDEKGISTVKKIKLGLTFALLLYDNYLVAIAPYEENSKLRYIVNQSGIDPDVKGYLREVSESYTDSKKIERLIKIIELMSQIEVWEEENPKANRLIKDGDNAYLNKLIYGSPSYSDIKKQNPLETESIFSLNRYRIFKNEIEDNIRLVINDATGQVSKIFGNTAGIIVSRRGVMENLSKMEKENIVIQLKPLDILLEKAPFRLTDHLIPGYWSHVGLWCGNEAELKGLAVWDTLSVLYENAVKNHHYIGPSFQESIRNGHSIIEALRPGVQINTLDHFLNIDDFGVIRFESLSLNEKRTYLVNAFAQIGKNYDFNFDVESKNEIVCSELIYITFDDMDWKTEKAVGRYTISPDNVAQKIINENISPVILYINGVEKNIIEEKFPVN